MGGDVVAYFVPMSNTSNLQKTGMQMLLGRDRFEALMAEADRVGLSMATVVRSGIDAWMAMEEHERQYEGQPSIDRVVDVAAREKQVTPTVPRLAGAFRRAPHDPRPLG